MTTVAKKNAIISTPGIADTSQRGAVTALRVLYPIWTIVGLFSIMYVPATLIVPGDAITTANNIRADELLFRIGIVGSLITQLIHIAVVLLLYRLFKTVDESQASLLVVLGLVGVPIAMLNTLNQLAVLVLLNSAEFAAALGVEQLHTLVMLFLNLNDQGIYIATIFWGLWLFPLAYLAYKSGYFPRILGVVLVAAGSGYLLDSLTRLVLPNYANYEGILLPAVTVLTLGEVVFMLWFVLRGAKLPEMQSRN